jgi:hypothetical protein
MHGHVYFRTTESSISILERFQTMTRRDLGFLENRGFQRHSAMIKQPRAICRADWGCDSLRKCTFHGGRSWLNHPPVLLPLFYYRQLFAFCQEFVSIYIIVAQASARMKVLAVNRFPICNQLHFDSMNDDNRPSSDIAYALVAFCIRARSRDRETARVASFLRGITRKKRKKRSFRANRSRLNPPSRPRKSAIRTIEPLTWM